MHTGNKNEWVSQYARIHAIREMETRRKARLENQALVGKRSFRQEVRKRQWRRRRAKFPMSLIDDTINFILIVIEVKMKEYVSEIVDRNLPMI